MLTHISPGCVAVCSLAFDADLTRAESCAALSNISFWRHRLEWPKPSQALELSRCTEGYARLLQSWESREGDAEKMLALALEQLEAAGGEGTTAWVDAAAAADRGAGWSLLADEEG